MSLLKMPPTRSEIRLAQVAVKAYEMLGDEAGRTISPRTLEVANWPEDQASPESEYPTLTR